jgi:hypothetical protein
MVVKIGCSPETIRELTETTRSAKSGCDLQFVPELNHDREADGRREPAWENPPRGGGGHWFSGFIF